MKRDGLEKYRYGNVSLLPDEEEAIRKQAIAAGKDPDKAVQETREKFTKATRRIHEAAGEKAHDETIQFLEKESGRDERLRKTLDGILRAANMRLLRQETVAELLLRYVERYDLGGFLGEYEEKDPDTFAHSLRASLLALDIAFETPAERNNLDGIAVGMLLHDIGKQDIPEVILKKPGRLTQEEMRLVSEHPVSGLKKLLHDERLSRAATVRGVKEITIGHHAFQPGESYPFDISDAKSLPRNLEGLDVAQWDTSLRHLIEIGVAADIFDALANNDRPYRKGLGTAQEIFDTMAVTVNIPNDLMKAATARFLNKTRPATDQIPVEVR